MSSSFRSVCITLVAIQFSLGRGGSSEAAEPDAKDPAAGVPTQQGWVPGARNPCLTFGELRPVASWNDPCVLKDGGKYVMYVTTAMLVPGRPPVRPFRAISSDGETWTLEPRTPLVAPGKDPSDFDYQSVETPSVVLFKGKYHMYYTGVQKGLAGPMAIGHATSEDGIAWTKDPNNPVLRATGKPSDFNGYQVAEPGAVVRGEQIFVYFSGVGLRPGGSPPARRVIALAKASDGSRSDAPKVVLEQSELYPAKLGFDGYSTPSAVVHGGRVHLYCDVGYFNKDAEHKWSQVALHHAVSDDGETQWTQDSQAIFTRLSFPWTSLEVRSPSALFEDGVLHLWYAGNANVAEFLPEIRSTGRTAKFGIGHATRKEQ